MMAGDRRYTRSSIQSEMSDRVDVTEINDELGSIEQHCQLCADMLNASKKGETTDSDRQVLKVTALSSIRLRGIIYCSLALNG